MAGKGADIDFSGDNLKVKASIASVCEHVGFTYILITITSLHHLGP